MFEKFLGYSVKDTYVAHLINVWGEHGANLEKWKIKDIDNKMLVRKTTKKAYLYGDLYGEYFYEEIFTGSLFRQFNCFESSQGEAIILRLQPIVPYCTDKELKAGKVSRNRLIKIYNTINNGNKEMTNGSANFGSNVRVFRKKNN
jgi:hypothetical protein